MQDREQEGRLASKVNWIKSALSPTLKKGEIEVLWVFNTRSFGYNGTWEKRRSSIWKGWINSICHSPMMRFDWFCQVLGESGGLSWICFSPLLLLLDLWCFFFFSCFFFSLPASGRSNPDACAGLNQCFSWNCYFQVIRRAGTALYLTKVNLCLGLNLKKKI